MKIGVLALQGAFHEHIQMLKKLNVETFEIRNLEDFIRHKIDGIIIPGGESTVIRKLLDELALFEPLKQALDQGLPAFGTCAGMILLAKSVENGHVHLDQIDIHVRRNAYGRQLGSFYTEQECKYLGVIPMTFIRAPYILSLGDTSEILASVDGHIVAARNKHILVTAFHPELNTDLSLHRYFIKEFVKK